MVNGPRPSCIAKPATAMSLGTPSARTHSPMILQRQQTSLYSTCSTSTLVFGKAATPIAGDWSAEPWTPANIRPMNLTDMLQEVEPEDVEEVAETEDQDDQTIQETASVAETTAFSERRAVETAAAVPPVAAATAAAHVAFVYRYDPYSPQSCKRELYRCECDECLEGLACGQDNLAAGSYSYAATQPQHMEITHSDEYRLAAGHDLDDATSSRASYRGQPHPHQYATYESAQYWSAATESVPEVAPPPSSFVPPPPPPKITRGVIAESSEDNLDVDAAFYHIAMRWYSKTTAVQQRFVKNGDMCPEPQREGETFQQWVDAVGKWWLRHFENAQTKTSVSSGLLRTATAPAHARLAGSNGFETHASVSDSFAMHKRALRSFPHREVGLSGLTEALLRTHEKAMPAPRSRQQQLPW